MVTSADLDYAQCLSNIQKLNEVKEKMGLVPELLPKNNNRKEAIISLQSLIKTTSEQTYD